MSKKYSAIVCSFIWPLSPGHSGGEIRDFHLFKHLSAIAAIRFISMSDSNLEGRETSPGFLVEERYSPAILRSRFPQFIDRHAFRRPWFSRFIGLLRMLNLPVWGPKYHRDIALVSWQIEAYILPTLRRLLDERTPDFIFVTPQLNPTLLQLNANLSGDVRTILLTYDVEAVRMSHLAGAQSGLARYAAQMESRRAEKFERENLCLFDGVVVVSDLDKEILTKNYGLESERVLTIENSVDTDYFSFARQTEDTDDPTIVFIGNLAYWPNHDAAVRLIREIMPRIRSVHPRAKAWIVGDRPSRDLEALADPEFAIITGRVEDVRPYLRQAAVVCVPLRAGSGTKYKVLEALSAGRPVVCTSVAAEGLELEPETHFLLANSDEEIANACNRILENSGAFRNMAGKARQQIEQYYSWEHNLEKLDVWLNKIKQMPKREGEHSSV
jgi:glycosyltransferase involved in cell wall biosynthesis